MAIICSCCLCFLPMGFVSGFQKFSIPAHSQGEGETYSVTVSLLAGRDPIGSGRVRFNKAPFPDVGFEPTVSGPEVRRFTILSKSIHCCRCLYIRECCTASSRSLRANDRYEQKWYCNQWKSNTHCDGYHRALRIRCEAGKPQKHAESGSVCGEGANRQIIGTSPKVRNQPDSAGSAFSKDLLRKPDETVSFSNELRRAAKHCFRSARHSENLWIAVSAFSRHNYRPNGS